MDKAYGKTVVSALVLSPDASSVLLKRTEGGRYSLLGGYPDLTMGYVDSLRERVLYDVGADITPLGIHKIYQNRSRTGNWITNVCALAKLNEMVGLGKESAEWIGTEDVLSGEVELRTPDTYHAISNYFLTPLASLDFFQVNATHPLGLTERLSDVVTTKNLHETSVCGIVVSCGEKYLLMECNRSKFRGKLSLVGGKVDSGKTLEDTFISETLGETGRAIMPLGLVGLWANQMGDHVFTSLIGYGMVEEEFDFHSEEVSKLVWMRLDEILTKQSAFPDAFRTFDVVQAIQRVHSIRTLSDPVPQSLLPLSFIHSILNN